MQVKNEKEQNILIKIKELCELSGIDFSKYLEEMYEYLYIRVNDLFTPSREWFKEGKSFNRYWKYLEDITGHQWQYEDVKFWYSLLRHPSETREEISPELRYKVIERDNSICRKCGRRPPDVQLEVDHIIPWSKGGPTTLDNLQTLCEECNIGKSNKYFKGGPK